jgi:NitT/TauT family transport system substrate-binding protein
VQARDHREKAGAVRSVRGRPNGRAQIRLSEPDKSVALHLESVKEFQGGSVANQKVSEYGQAVSTALGVVPAVRQHGLGYMDPELVATTAKTVETYMAAKNVPPTETLFTNKFVGPAKLTEPEWVEVEKRSEKYLPRRSS